jgi:hypothetical protein
LATLRLIPTAGSPYEIAQDPIVVGRDPSCDVVLNDGSVSRRHARIERRGSVWAVVDQGSANGTFVDSHRVSDAVLRHGQELRLGSVSLRVELSGATDLGMDLGSEPEATVVQPRPTVQPPLPPTPPPPPIPAPRSASPPPPPQPPSRFPSGRPGSLTPPVAPMDPGAAAAPPKKGKGPFFWIVTGCFGCLTMVILFVALIGGGVFYWTRGAVDVVSAQLTDLREGRTDDAYGRLSQEYRVRLSRADFERAIASHPSLKENAEGRFWPPGGSVRIVNERGRVSGTLVSASGQREDAVFDVVKESGQWRIASIEVGGAPLEASALGP